MKNGALMVKMKVALAIECSHTRGMGHLFRSFYYLDYLKKENIDYVYLINNDKPALEILKSRGVDYLIVDYSDTSSNWEAQIIKEYGINIWINDKFETSYELARNVKKENIFLALIDDMGEADELCDIYFAGFIAFTKTEYKARNVRYGTRYMVLNPEIQRYRRKRDHVDRILVSLGGADPYDTSVSVVEELLNYEYDFDILIGADSTCLKQLQELDNGRFHIYQNVPSAIELFSHYDFAITGGGLTCCEANAAGIPCIIIANAPHEINTGICVEKMGGSVFAGDHSDWNRAYIRDIKNLDIQRMSECGMKAFDLGGVEIIFNEVVREYKLLLEMSKIH